MAERPQGGQVQRYSSPGHPRRPKFVLHEPADIDRLMRHLVWRFRMPRIEVAVEVLPESVEHPLRQRIVHLADRDAGLFGEVLAGLTVLGGMGYLWVASRQWLHLLWLAFAASGMWLIGRVCEFVWTRIRLLWMLRRLKREVVAWPASTGPAPQPVARSVPAPLGAGELLDRPSLQPEAYRVSPPAAAGVPSPTARDPEDSARRAVLRDTADIDRLLRRVVSFAPLPAIEVGHGALDVSVVHGAQHRIAQRATACNCVFGALLAGATLMVGGAWVVWSSSGNWAWHAGASWSWRPLWLLGAAVVAAGSIGWLAEMFFHRVRLAVALMALRRRLRAAGEQAR